MAAGLGFIEGRKLVRPDEWFFDGHFKNDPCMPGTLMLEVCVQTLAIYLASQGVTLERDQGANVWLGFAIREGKNREVRNVMAHLGLEVNRLIRISFGPFQLRDLKPGKRLFLFATGTGLAPFMSLIHDPETYDRFEKIILIHGVRWTNELAYHDYIEQDLKDHEYLGEEIRDKLVYYPTVTREPFRNNGRQTDLITSGKLFRDIDQSPLDPATDRAMICGSPAMLKEISAMLDGYGFQISPHIGEAGDYVIERAFVEQ